MNIPTGFSYYGQDIGILVNASQAPRLPGDAGHAATFAYPVRYQITGTTFLDLVEGSEETRAKILSAAQALKDAGIRGIVADCGLMSLYQEDVAREIGIPFVGSSLCQIPMAWQLIGRSGTIGILTGHSQFLRETHLRRSGWDETIPLAIEGMECQSHFAEIVIQGGQNLDPAMMCENVLSAAKNLSARTPDLKALILECSNLASYSRAVAQALNIPVFDTVSAANLLQYSLVPPKFDT